MIIQELKERLRKQCATINALLGGLGAIAALPDPTDDNDIAAHMRAIATDLVNREY